MCADIRLKTLVRDNRKTIILMTVWTAISYFTNAAHMLCWGRLLLCIMQQSARDSVYGSAAWIVLSLLVMKASDYLLVKKKAEYCGRFNNRYREKLFDKLFRLGPAYIERKRTGAIISTLWEKVEWIGYYLYYYIPVIASIIIFSFAAAALFIQEQTAVSAAFLGSGMIIVMTPLFFGKVLKNRSEKEWEDNDSFYSTCLDGLQGIATLKALNANELHRQKVQELSEENRISIMKNLHFTTLNTRTVEFLISAAEYAIDIIGIFAAGNGKISFGCLLMLYVVTKSWSDGARRLFGAWLRGNKGMAAFRYADEIMREECAWSLTETDADQSSSAAAFEKEICFEHVTFSYLPEGEPAVQDVCLTIPRGSKTSIVGSSGSGKTTMLHLLFGFYKPQGGRITIDGTVPEKESIRSVQRMITAIWQDCRIFHMSCYDNIRIAKPDATPEEVHEAAKKANIHDLINSLPEGYETIIGDGGTVLSGGEKQRIAIARAFLRDTPILILDEATSSLDRKNEREIQECLERLCEGKTVLSISHRMNSARNADQIVVMEHGRVAECGTHNQLISKSGRYSELLGQKYQTAGAEA